jgi:hypothetical protein
MKHRHLSAISSSMCERVSKPTNFPARLLKDADDNRVNSRPQQN